MSTTGWVYIIANNAMPGIVNVGYTTKGSFLRAKQLNGAGIPYNFQVMYEAFVVDPRAVEQAAHAILASKHEGKEWFRCSQEEVMAAIKACAKTILSEREYIDCSKVDFSTQDEEPAKPLLIWCPYHRCGKQATLPYKEKHYCEKHYKILRKQRFDWIRSIQNG